MNLRQKIKKAKEELKVVKETYVEHTTWDIVKKHQKTRELEKIINFKRKYNRYYHWNEEQQIDWGNLTYISFHADYRTLAVLTTPNGKPLKKKDVVAFMDMVSITHFYEYAKRVSKETVDEKRVIKHIDYFLSVSNDRTKNKKLHVEKLCYQFIGDDRIHTYNSVKYA